MSEEWHQIKTKKKYTDAASLKTLLEASGSNNIKLKKPGGKKRG